MSRVILVLILGGIGLFYFGWTENQLSSLSQPTPTAITLDELARNGPGDNAHLVVGDFFLCTWDFIYVENGGRWVEAWVPAVPLGGTFHQQYTNRFDEDGNWPEGEPLPVPETLNVVFRLTEARNGEAVYDIAMEDTLQGMVINEIDGLDAEEMQLLRSSYPRVNFDEVYIFEPGRRPEGAGVIYGAMGGGPVLSLGGIALLLARRRRRQPETMP